ncbi:MAG: hypothetical protein IKN34_13040 [Treponema sp.]|nr:hypothetical protein [Treponema sp.]
MFFRGLIYWVALVAVLSALGFGFWKYLTSVLGYENRRKEIALGVSCIVLTFAAFLFTPVILFSSEGLVKNVVAKIQENVAKNSKDEFSKDRESLFKDFAERMVRDHAAPAPEFDVGAVLPEVRVDESISDAIEFARKKAESSDVNIAQSLDGVVDYLEKEEVLSEIPKEEAVKEIKVFVREVFVPYCDEAKKEFGIHMNPVMHRFFEKAVKSSPFELVSGVPDSELSLEKAVDATDKWISKMIPKFFIFVASVSAFFCLVFLVIILIHLRESESRRKDEFKKDHIFEYQESVFADINKEKK